MSEQPPEKLADIIKPPHRGAEIVFAVMSFAIAILLAFQWQDQTRWFDGQALGRQPGLWPLIAIIGMLVFGLGELIACFLRNRQAKRDDVWPEVLHWAKAGEYLLWFLGYVYLVPWMGYLPASVLFCTALAFRLGYRGKTLLIAALMAVLIVVVFKGFLSVRIPGGEFYELFPRAIRNFLVLYL